MNNFTPKLFELHSLQSENSTFLLKVKTIQKKKTIYLQLEIDHKTFQQMKPLVKFEDNARYRISLRSTWDPFRKEHLSTITKSKGSIIETYDFICSKEYTEILNQLNNVHHQKKINLKLNQQILPKQSLSKYAKPLVGIAVTICLLLISFNNILINVNIFPSSEEKNKVVDVHSEVNKQSASAHLQDEQVDSNFVEQQEDLAAELTEAFNVESSLTYGLPEGYAAITFDDGPSQYTKEIIDILNEYEIQATFFFMGQNSLNYPDSVKYAQDHNMSVGAHSWDHQDFTNLSANEQLKDLVASSEVISSILDEPVALFRPPYGAFNDSLLQNTISQDMKMILWNRDSNDWKANSAEEITEYMNNVEASGGIFLFHEKIHTVKALPAIIEHLLQNNIKLVVLE